MDEVSLLQGEWFNQTTIHPLALVILVICGILLFFLPRNKALWPFVIIVCFISSAQRIVIFSLDFNLLRVMVFLGLLRILFKYEYIDFKLQTYDKLLIIYFFGRIIANIFVYGGFSSLVSVFGTVFEELGLYFLFRMLVRTWEDNDEVINAFVVLSIPVALFFYVEHSTGRNLFSIFGGVSEYSQVRGDRLRCQGAFTHPIIAGVFWAALLPLFVARFWDKSKNNLVTLLGIVSILWIIVAVASSTPVFGLLIGIIGGLMFYMRYSLRWVRWGILFLILSLHMVMKAPVWNLISRVSAVSGSTSYYRYKLIDSAIHNFGEWALFGMRSTAHWFHGSWDITNQYILIAVKGGTIVLILFIMQIAIAFKYIGSIWRLVKYEKKHLAMAWALGVSLLIHCTNFIGVSYFGQISMIWYLLLATIVNINLLTKKTNNLSKT